MLRRFPLNSPGLGLTDGRVEGTLGVGLVFLGALLPPGAVARFVEEFVRPAAAALGIVLPAPPSIVHAQHTAV